MSPPWTNLASLAIGGPLYGLYVVLYLTSTTILVRRSNRAHTGPLYRSTVFITGLILFVAVTGNFCLVEARAFLGLIVFANGTEPRLFYDDNSQITTTVQNIFAALSIIMGDFIIIYRLYIVWSRNRYIIIVPTLSLIGLVITLILAVRTTSKIDNIADDTSLTPGLVFTLVTNLYSTGFISWKIWMITNAASPVHGGQLRHFVAIIVESAAIYTVWATFYIITHQINADIQFVALGVLPAIAGIASALIQARIGMGQSVERRSTSAPVSSGPLRLTTRRGGMSTGDVSRNEPLELKSVPFASSTADVTRSERYKSESFAV